ncbi:MAG: CdaR family protein [Chloroflexota bacterium]
MRRILARFFNNWPLKVAAVILASLMYGGLALSQNTETFPGVIPVQYINQSPNTVVIPQTPLPVTLVRYFAPPGIQPATGTFLATIDLSGVADKVGVVSVQIDVTTPDSRIRVLGHEPQYATITLDRLESKKGIPVKVVHGPVPAGMTLGPTVVDPPTVTVSGAAALVSQVDAVRADVAIQSTGLDVNEDVQLIPIDKLGNALRLEVTPATARVAVPVTSDAQSRTLLVNPVIGGDPAAGFEIESVTVNPQTVLVAGDANQLAQLTRVDTVPIPMTGVSGDETVTVGLALPTGIVAVGDPSVSVSIKLRPVTGTRTFTSGLRLVGAASNLAYTLSTDRVLVTIGGSTADLDRLSGAALVMDLDVAGLKPGKRDVPVTANLPVGMTLVASSPPTVTVTIGTAPASPAPSASPTGG